MKKVINIISPQPSGSRNNSLTVTEGVEITRQFLATNNKVINRGDSSGGGSGQGARALPGDKTLQRMCRHQGEVTGKEN